MRRSPFLTGSEPGSLSEFSGRGAISLPGAMDGMTAGEIAIRAGRTTRSVRRALGDAIIGKRGLEYVFDPVEAEKFILNRTKPVGLCPFCGDLCSSNRAGTCGRDACLGRQKRAKARERAR